jgi:beta-phosphoglucomutase
MTELKTILFDLDGVVIDSEPLHAKAKKIVLDRFNLEYPAEIFNDFKGRPDNVFFEYVSGKLDPLHQPFEVYYSAKKAVFEEIFTELKLIDGFLVFLSKVKELGIKTAMVSSTSLYSLGLIDSQFNISEMFDLVITEVDTEHHKPYPDPYLKALDLMNASTQSTIVIEDSPNGIISAKKAGCFVYGLTSSFDGKTLMDAGADEIVDSYKSLMRKLSF